MYPGDLSYGIAVAALAAVTSSQFMLLCHTLAAILRRRVSALRPSRQPGHNHTAPQGIQP